MNTVPQRCPFGQGGAVDVVEEVVLVEVVDVDVVVTLVVVVGGKTTVVDVLEDVLVVTVVVLVLVVVVVMVVVVFVSNETVTVCQVDSAPAHAGLQVPFHVEPGSGTGLSETKVPHGTAPEQIAGQLPGVPPAFQFTVPDPVPAMTIVIPQPGGTVVVTDVVVTEVVVPDPEVVVVLLVVDVVVDVVVGLVQMPETQFNPPQQPCPFHGQAPPSAIQPHQE